MSSQEDDPVRYVSVHPTAYPTAAALILPPPFDQLVPMARRLLIEREIMEPKPINCDFVKESGVSCSEQAGWRIVWGDGDDDYADTCKKHAGHMLADADEQKVYKIRQEEDDG